MTETTKDAQGGEAGMRRPLADLLGAIDAYKARLAEQMPDTESCCGCLYDAANRMNEIGWRPGVYCPKDGTYFHGVEIGSPRVLLHCRWLGAWPEGSAFADEAGDSWPVHLAFWRAADCTDTDNFRTRAIARATGSAPPAVEGEAPHG